MCCPNFNILLFTLSIPQHNKFLQQEETEHEREITQKSLQLNSENSSDTAESPEQRRTWSRMDMYVNPSEHALENQASDLSRQKQQEYYIGKENVVLRNSDNFNSPMLGDGTAGLISRTGYDVEFPANEDDVRIPSKEKIMLKQKPSSGDTGSSTLGSPFAAQLFQTGGTDEIAMGGTDAINLGGGGGGLAIPYNRVSSRRYERIDRIAMKLFPIIFILFNVCYWSYYLLLHETFQELW